MLAAMVPPVTADAMRDASKKCVACAPAAAVSARLRRSVGSEKSALRVNSPGSTSARSITMVVTPRSTAANTLRLPATTMSPPSTRSASRAAMRIA